MLAGPERNDTICCREADSLNAEHIAIIKEVLERNSPESEA